MENIQWTQRGNLMSSPNDCPQRDERLGWMGDIQAFAQTAIFNMDLAAFFTKLLPSGEPTAMLRLPPGSEAKLAFAPHNFVTSFWICYQ